MKFDPSIIFFVIIVFFVLPSVLKKILIKKRIKKTSYTSVSYERSSVSGMKTEAEPREVLETESKNSSILGKIVLQARQFIREAQKRAEEQRQLQQNNNVNLKNTQGQNHAGNLKQAGKTQETIWDILAERADDDFDESQDSIVTQNALIRENSNSLKSAVEKPQQADAVHFRDDFHTIKSVHTSDTSIHTSDKSTHASDGLASGVLKSEKTGYKPEGMFPIKDRRSLVRQKGRETVSCKKYRFKTDPLQNAVVWSEILSKPVALKDNS